MDDKIALRGSQAGMRFIAQMTIFNSGDFDRLRVYITESYHPDLLTQEAVDGRVAAFREQHVMLGKLRVVQLIGLGKHHVIVLLEAQRTEAYLLNDLQVEEDYPHRVLGHSLTPLE